MPYNEAIEARIKKIVSSWENTVSKKRFMNLPAYGRSKALFHF